VIDRLGDKERAQLKARDTLVILGGFAFRSGSGSAISKAGKGVETPIAIFERFLKEGGLASKVWKVREQVHVFSRLYEFNYETNSAWFFLLKLVYINSCTHSTSSSFVSYQTIPFPVG
jgi:hypothetical protein